ncbi:hypothetical protein [Bifidobacterium asteroides]|uniref:hypothetical protein n=1 Tax=Bifidobacterium asteroides TaxID=1684 RepID=UPI0020C38BED|nr:hypothetical protein [Bifidobacterium asteroides]MCP8614325.1 hypothetical protein [Bifidobacterium asteroides]
MDRLTEDLDEAFELLSRGASRADEYVKTSSPDRLEFNSDKQRKDSFIKWAGIGLCVMMVCFGILMLVYSVFQIGLCSKWFL